MFDQVIAFAQQPAAAPIWAFLGIIITQLVFWKVNQTKTRTDSYTLQLNAVNTASATLTTNLFKQVEQLTSEVVRLRGSAEFFEKKYNEAYALVQALREEIDTLRQSLVGGQPGAHS